MESDRPHRTTSSSSTSELFICFTSRLSSSSMKISSKSILSPGRAREPSQISLSSSLSRRLKNSGSMKGGQASPMFPTGGKKRGCAFENPEPSSPKVTCIGQVRVKTKKQGKKMRTRSKRRSEASFRTAEQSVQSTIAGQEHHQSHESHQGGFQFQNQQQQECLPHRNQRWVHLPLTICEALRAFGAEFNCFLPCRSSCMASDKDKEEKGVRSANGSSCGAVFARWLVALQDGEGKGREIELVVGEEEERTGRSISRRRQVFEGIEIKEETKEVLEEEEARVSVCIPPKNALLLMRCRSDPVKMAALASRFWESPAPKDEDDGDGDEDEGHREKEAAKENLDDEAQVKVKLVDSELPYIEEHEEPQQQANLVMQEEAEEEEEVAEEVEENSTSSESTELDGLHAEIEEGEGIKEAGEEEEEEGMEQQELGVNVNQQPVVAEEETVLSVSLRDILGDVADQVEDEESEAEVVFRENEYDQESQLEEERELEVHEEKTASFSISSLANVQSEQQEAAAEDDKGGEEDEDKAEAEIEVTEGSTEEEETRETVTHQVSKPEYPNTHELKSPVLPDCLLMMMCEPKLSMEVSKETWVCSTDFVRWLPERKVNQKNGPDEPKKQQQQLRIRYETDSAHSSNQARQLMQPPRSSCSFPVPAAPSSMATIIEEKLVGSKAYEPFVLTRCKSEPMRSSAKFAPEPCFWKNRKLEQHRPARVGAAGVGF
ncbi:hypothetical protein FNV43_RR16374 [Rhamnella rubrinervis]|uniref:Uncharacterized protein n=1 Tax=Rhamnella rubrinervis TaxID=2594499 RepID=A0A8K0GYN6_9ROSA|nr:hypothetical protein FNV43_RR16374 [Rhamnella rubrinervis]